MTVSSRDYYKYLHLFIYLLIQSTLHEKQEVHYIGVALKRKINFQYTGPEYRVTYN